MKIHSFAIDQILISKSRQRKLFSPEDVAKLAASISQVGLIQPVVVRKDAEGNIVLVAGERRIKALTYIWNFGEEVKCGEFAFPENQVPCIFQGEMDPIDAFEMELEENIRRVDLTWQERATATSQLASLREQQAIRDGKEPPAVVDIAVEIHGGSRVTAENPMVDITRKELIVAKHLDDKDVAGAKTMAEGFKILKRKEEIRKNEALAQQIGVTYSSAVHSLHHGDCFEVMGELDKESFDVILTDPPYGIDADTFGDSGGKAAGAHFYSDSWDYWNRIAKAFAVESFRLAKPQAHVYAFCDIDQFILFKNYMQEAGWRVFRTPLVWVNPTAFRTPWPEHGPQRKYQIALFAIKGDRPVSRIYPDVITCASDENKGHPAQKPVDLYVDLLRRSVRAGDTVLDPFGGSGTIISACNEMKCRATYIEIDSAAYGIAIARLKELS